MSSKGVPIVAGLAVLAVFAAPVAAQEIRPGVQQGLGLMGPETPAELKDIQADPYALPRAPGCGGVAGEIAAINRILGPDVDEDVEKEGPSLIGGAVRTFIPYRGVVRLLTGAGKKEQQLTEAALAASARRGYLRGLETSMNCGAQAGDLAATPATSIEPLPQTPEPAPATTAENVPSNLSVDHEPQVYGGPIASLAVNP